MLSWPTNILQEKPSVDFFKQEGELKACSPNNFLMKDWNKLENSRKNQIFFARKFESIVDQQVNYD